MIELRGVVVAAGTRPVSATIRAGEIVRVDGPHAAALCEVLAGRRAPVAGAVIRRGTRSAILLRASDRLPGDAADALRLFAALAGAAPGAIALPEGDEARAIARARVVAPDLWIVDGVLGAAAEELVQAAAEEIRAGGAAMVWTAAADPRRGRVDRVITIEVGEGAAAGEAAPRATGRGGGVAAYVTATAASRAALGFAALAAGCLALVAWTVAAHEGFWFAPGSAEAMDPVGPIAVATIAVLAGVMAAVRAAAAPTWPAMLRDTGVAAPRRVAAVVAGDVAPVLPAAARSPRSCCGNVSRCAPRGGTICARRSPPSIVASRCAAARAARRSPRWSRRRWRTRSALRWASRSWWARWWWRCGEGGMGRRRGGWMGGGRMMIWW